MPNYKNAKFILSAAKISQLPPDKGIEIAIVGRSNAGKSSVLNRLTDNKNLARVSKTPGRTQHINLFSIDEKNRIADLPGYGYAMVPHEIKNHWQKTIDAYMRNRESLRGLILVMDIRHPLKEFDLQMLSWCDACKLPVHILLNKSDKLSTSKAKATLFKVAGSLKDFAEPHSVQLFSALKKTGIKELQILLDKWFS